MYNDKAKAFSRMVPKYRFLPSLLRMTVALFCVLEGSICQLLLVPAIGLQLLSVHPLQQTKRI